VIPSLRKILDTFVLLNSYVDWQLDK